MKEVYVDTFYWVALANPRDPWHEMVVALRPVLDSVQLVTTDEVLTEFLSFVSGSGAQLRARAVELVEAVFRYALVLPQTRDSFLAGLDLYRRRPDKEYSLVDCISMVTMRSRVSSRC